MIRPRFRSGIIAAFSLMWMISGSVHSADIKDIRMWHAPDRTRIVFDMDNGSRFKAFTLKNPDRVVIDLPGTRLKSRVPEAGTTGQFISRIRVGRPDSNTLRVVFDVKKPVRYFIQLLKPVDNYRYRLVVDYYHQDAILEADKPAQSKIPESTRQRKNRQGDLLVLIDPGHGGEDPGALGTFSREKNIVLQIAKILKAQLDREPGIRAELTRMGDYYISLRKRTRIARELQADLFVSIHADAFKNRNAV